MWRKVVRCYKCAADWSTGLLCHVCPMSPNSELIFSYFSGSHFHSSLLKSTFIGVENSPMKCFSSRPALLMKFLKRKRFVILLEWISMKFNPHIQQQFQLTFEWVLININTGWSREGRKGCAAWKWNGRIVLLFWIKAPWYLLCLHFCQFYRS